MKNVQKELLSITASLSALASKIEKMAEAIANDTEKVAPVKKAKAPAKKAKVQVKKAKATPKKRAAKKVAPVAKTAQKKTTEGKSIFDRIYGMVSGSSDGITVAMLKKKTGLETRQVNNALYKLKQKGRIEAISRGVYAVKKA